MHNPSPRGYLGFFEWGGGTQFFLEKNRFKRPKNAFFVKILFFEAKFPKWECVCFLGKGDGEGAKP